MFQRIRQRFHLLNPIDVFQESKYKINSRRSLVYTSASWPKESGPYTYTRTGPYIPINNPASRRPPKHIRTHSRRPRPRSLISRSIPPIQHTRSCCHTRTCTDTYQILYLRIRRPDELELCSDVQISGAWTSRYEQHLDVRGRVGVGVGWGSGIPETGVLGVESGRCGA